MRKLTILLGSALLWVCFSFTAQAQMQNMNLPLDTAVRIGHLDNGLTYMIRHNALPEKKVDFYIAQKVGSILEEDNQRGLAHFLEHMCFNGTRHFPGDGLKQYLERIGVKFGVNLNAYTSIDETVYHMTNVPVQTAGAIDSCLWILCDWADGLTLDPTEIDKERGVIHEEWRTRQNATMRIYDQLLPVLYPTERYAHRMPIGTMEIVDHFPYKDLRDYYEKWYRPDLQGIIVVGDVNVDEMEAKIKSIFSTIDKPVNPAERIYYPVADNKEPIFACATDKELESVDIQLMYKHEAIPTEMNNSILVYAQNLIKNIAFSLLNQRYDELTQKANPPFSGASVGDGEYFLSKTKDAFTAAVSCKEEGIDTAFVAMLRELERASRFGFTQSELDRLIASTKSALETNYKERDKRKNEDFTGSYVRHFIDNTSMLSADDNYQLANQMLDNIKLEMVNSIIPSLLTDSNQVLVVTGPQKEGLVYPTKEHFFKLMADVKAEKLAPYEDKVSNEPLMTEKPKGGKVVKEEKGKYDSKIWTLSNGVKVIMKPTDFKADEISLYAVSPGGTAQYPVGDMLNIKMLEDGSVISEGGLGNFNNIELRKKMAGKIASAGSYVNSQFEGVSGGCAPKFFETMLQLVYLRLTAPRQDAESFASLKEHYKTSLKNQELDPSLALGDTLRKVLYNNHPRAMRIKYDDVDKINYDQVFSYYKDRMKDCSDFTFFIVGNINYDSIKPYVETYLGGLPATGRKEKIGDSGIRVQKGMHINNFLNKMETPKSTEIVIYSGDCPYTLENDVLMSFTSQILNIVYTNEVREKEGGTYGVGVQGSVDLRPVPSALMYISFDTDPARRADMTKIILAQIDKFIAEGPSQENVDKVREYMLKQFNENVKENSYWSGALNSYYTDGLDFYAGYESAVKKVTIKDLQAFLKKLIDQNNRSEVSMSPKE